MSVGNGRPTDRSPAPTPGMKTTAVRIANQRTILSMVSREPGLSNADLARRSGFEGRLVILPEPDIDISDCKIEWADGGCTLDRAATDTRIGELVERYMAARNQAEDTAGRNS